MNTPTDHARDPDGPLGHPEFARLLNNLAVSDTRYKPSALAVAVSGGADSMALTLMAAHWAARRNISLTALTVDHGLRRGSAAEARNVGVALKARGIKHQVLKWRGNKPSANIQALARQARYDLLTSWCRKHKTPDLLLAHHLDDQAETVLLRLMRGSSVDGLSAMSAVREEKGVRLLRPLLSVRADRLKATCQRFAQDWVEDPANRNEAFARVRVRHLLAELAPLGLDASRLARTAKHMSRVRATLDQETDRLASELVSVDDCGLAEFSRAAFKVLPMELALRLLNRCLKTVGGGDWSPRFDRLENLYLNLVNNEVSCRQTLARCVVSASGDSVRLYRENRHLPEIVVGTSRRMIWDSRFLINLKISRPASSANLIVGPLGKDGWQAACQLKQVPELRTAVGHLPMAARQALPALWWVDPASGNNENGQKRSLLAQPQLDIQPDSAGISVSATFSPKNRLISESFPVVSPVKDIIY